MIRVGVIGVGMIGNVHLDAHALQTDAKVVAVSDRIKERRDGSSRQALNVTGTQQGFADFANVRQYTEGTELIADPDIDLIDICVPTPEHVDLAIAALRAGKHVLVEKPLSTSAKEAQRLVQAARESSRLIMCAQCMRFWPGWPWLKDAVTSGRYGKILGAQFRRVSSFPGKWYGDSSQSGGAVLDLHVHDTDFIHWCFGMPKAVRSVGYTRDSGGVDHIITQYIYDNIPMVVAEGGWSMAEGFGFNMQYCVNFEQATAVFDLSQKNPLRVLRRASGEEIIELSSGMGYEHEIRYFLECIRKNTSPQTITLEQASESLRICEAERQSVLTGNMITL